MSTLATDRSRTADRPEQTPRPTMTSTLPPSGPTRSFGASSFGPDGPRSSSTSLRNGPPPGSRARLLTPLLLVLMFVAGIAAARAPQTIRAIRGQGNWIDPVREAHAALSAAHADVPDEEAMQRRAIEGMLEALNDPYAEYIPPVDRADFEKELTGTYSGIGAEIEIRDGWLTIAAPLEDSPALRAGLMPNDRVIKIEDQSTYRLSVEECISRLVGQEGTPVNITVLRAGKELPFTLVRQRIVARSVRGLERVYVDGQAANGDETHEVSWNYLIDPAARIGYVRLSQFTPTADADLLSALEEANRQSGAGGLAGLILDLRGNPGGALEAAVRIADVFLPRAEVVSVRGRAVEDQVFRAADAAPAGGKYESLPVVVLVDRISASASEIVAGALQDHGRAVVIGSRTFGKGLVQSVIPMMFKRDAQLKFTTAKYYLPSGRLIQREDESETWGVDPTPGYLIIENDEALVERILRRRRIDARSKDGAEAAPTPAPTPDQAPGEAPIGPTVWTDPQWIAEQAADPALAGALRAMRGRLEAGAFTAINDSADQTEQHARLATEELRRLERAERLMAMEMARIAKRMEALAGDSNGEAGARASAEPEDLWSDELNLTGGLIEIRDARGDVVATLRITGRDVERWLANADVRPAERKPDAANPEAEQGRDP